MKKFVRRFVQYGITPIFLVLAAVNFMIERSGGGHSAHTVPKHSMHDMPAMTAPPIDMNAAMDMSSAGGMMSILGSMWLMYLLMGLAHISPWLSSAK